LGNVCEDDFVIKINSPITMFAKFEDIKQIFILRKPEDLIPSIITKTLGGLSQNISAGVPMPHEDIDISIEKLIKDQCYNYTRYIYGLEKNIHNLIPFTFEQVTNDINFITKNVLNIETKENYNILIEEAKINPRFYNKNDIGYFNAFPVEKKPDIYYEIKEKILKNNFDEYIDMYNLSLKLIENYQKENMV